MEPYAARSTSTKEKKLTSPPSRRSFAKRSPSTVLASQKLRRKRSPEDNEDDPVNLSDDDFWRILAAHAHSPILIEQKSHLGDQASPERQRDRQSLCAARRINR